MLFQMINNPNYAEKIYFNFSHFNQMDLIPKKIHFIRVYVSHHHPQKVEFYISSFIYLKGKFAYFYSLEIL